MVECFLHVLKKYIYDLFNVFRRKWLNLLYTDFKYQNISLISNISYFVCISLTLPVMPSIHLDCIGVVMFALSQI